VKFQVGDREISAEGIGRVGAVRAAAFRARAHDEWVMSVERGVPEADLAWALVEAAKPHLSAVERNDVFMAIGAGETFAAIRQLFSWVAIKGIPVGLDLVECCTTWLHAYAGHEDERYLRRLIENFLIPLPFSDHTFIGVDRTRQHRYLVSSSIAGTGGSAASAAPGDSADDSSTGA
jgi:hypothetical protein